MRAKSRRPAGASPDGRRQAQGGGVEGDRPALPSREPVLERRHRGADDADVDAPVVVQRRLVAERSPSRRGWPAADPGPAASGPSPRPRSPWQPAQLARYTSAPSARSGGRLGSSSRDTPYRVGERGGRRSGPWHRGCRARPVAFTSARSESTVATGSSSALGGQRRGGATGLLEEEAGLLDLGRGHDATARPLRCGTPGRRGWRWRRPGGRRRPSPGQRVGEAEVRADSRIGSAAPMRVIFIRFQKRLA